MVSKALTHYNSILDGKSKARYLIAKSHPERSDASMHAKLERAGAMLRHCGFCERRCGVDRSKGERGHCGVLNTRISAEFLHMGEETDLIPSHTIFFTGCTFDCSYCQNWDISTSPESGAEILPDALAAIIKRRAVQGSRNVNWVGGDPTAHTHYVLETMKNCDVNLPQIWNSNMYMTDDAMGLLNGVIDIYLSDFKYGNDACALRLSNVPEYMRIVKRNHLIAREGAEMIIRHLVLPGHLECCTMPVLTWISDNLEDVIVNVMGQYRPEHRASEHPELKHKLSNAEHGRAVRMAIDLGLELA